MSVYALTVESGTPWEALVRRGKRVLPDADHQADMLLATESALAAAGLDGIAADDGVAGRELWITDGVSVRLLPEAWPGVAASRPQSVAVDPAATRILFSALGSETWREPYRIDLQLFRDGFESANSAAWSATVP